MRKRCSFRLDVLVRAAAAASPARAAGAPAPGGAGPDAPGAALKPAAAAGADVVMNGTLASGNCGLALRLGAATTHVQAYFAKAVNYTLMVTALSFVQARPGARPAWPARRARAAAGAAPALRLAASQRRVCAQTRVPPA
jgi:hypothetical protein